MLECRLMLILRIVDVLHEIGDKQSVDINLPQYRLEAVHLIAVALFDHISQTA